METLKLFFLPLLESLEFGWQVIRYVLIFVSAVTAHPTTAWVIQQLREAMPFGQQPSYLFRDNDGIYGDEVGRFLLGTGIEEVKTARGKIHLWKGMVAPYGESCWIT